MKKAIKNIIKGWITTLFGVYVLIILGLKFYELFDTITLLQAGMFLTFSVFGISLLFAPDDFIGRLVDKFVLKKKQDK